MKLPNRERAYIPRAKLEDYLLSETHAVGRSKAKFLRMFGFNKHNIHSLEERLLSIAHAEEVSEVHSSPHGEKYTIDGSLQTPVKKLVRVRTVWIIDKDQDRPRFVTAYPN